MATKYNLTTVFTAITETSGTIQNVGNESVELASSTNAVAGEGIVLNPGEKRSFKGALSARSLGDAGAAVNVVDFTEAGEGGEYTPMYVPVGSVTFASLPTTLTKSMVGWTYNVTDAFTTDSRFIEGSDVSYPAGQNVVVVEPSTGVYKYDCFAGAYVLPIASDTELGGIKISNSFTVSSDGTLSIKKAGKTILGAVKSSDDEGKVSVNNDGTMTYNPLGYRQPSTTYTVGNIAYHSALPTGWYLECTTPGISGSGDLTISSPSIGGTVSDGTVTWRICNVNANTNYQKIAMARHTRTTFTLANLISAVADQNLDKYGIKVGDYYVGASGYTYIVAGLNPLKGTHEYTITNNHCGLIVCTHTTHPWNASGNTYTGADNRGAGYANSDLHYYLVNTVLPEVKGDLGESHLYAHQKLLSNAVNTTQYNRFGINSGGASNWSWYSNQYISALTEHQVYGGIAWSSSGYDTGEADQQLEVFKEFKHTDIFGNEYVWLRDVASASDACYASGYGHARNDAASNALYVAALIAFH